ncbi:MAG: phosphatidylglycerophosphatase A [Oligoflexia bacterium]|nr:phosphatidylglycerophosphatase A [Oligoflexia bacterium]
MTRLTGRRAFDWSKATGLRQRAAVAIGTACGAGLVPFAPGSAGTLAGLPLAYVSAGWPLGARFAFWALLIAIGTWACKVFDETMGTRDNQNLVIDEVVGVAITGWTAGTDPRAWAAAFLLFRFFDILKPPPVRQVDRWSHGRGKGTSGWWSGFGVMADDLAAGLLGLLVMLGLQNAGIL